LVKLAARPTLDRTVLAVEACVGAPLLEEVLIRGLILAWCVGRIRRREGDQKWLTDARPAFVMCFAVARAGLNGNRSGMAFAAARGDCTSGCDRPSTLRYTPYTTRAHESQVKVAACAGPRRR